MQATIHESGSSLSVNDILQAEKRWGYPIPKAYQEFLLVTNGGYPEPSDFKIVTNDGLTSRVSLDFFLGMGVDEGISLDFYIQNYKDRLPNDLFPIACDPGGNIICINTSNDKKGQIFFWDHEEEVEEGRTPTYDNVYFIADDLALFLDSFT